MKIFCLIFIFFISSCALASDPYVIPISNKLVVEQTYSTSIKGNSSLHIIVARLKETRKYFIQPVFVAEDGTIEKLSIIKYKRLPKIISSHSNENVVTLLDYSEKKRTLTTIDIDTFLDTHIINEIEDLVPPEQTFSLSNKTLLISKINKNSALQVLEIISGNDHNTMQIEIPEKYLRDFRRMTKHRVDAVGQSMFVKTSSIRRDKLYLNGNKLVFTSDDLRNYKTKSFTIDLAGDTMFQLQEYPLSTVDKIKDYSSYYKKDVLFTVVSTKEDIVISSFDFKESTELGQISLHDELVSSQKDKESFEKSLAKGHIKSKITLNTTLEGNLHILIDFIDDRIDFFRQNPHNTFNNDWWRFRQLQQFEQMKFTLPNTKFTPSQEWYEELDDLYFQEEYKSIQFVIDSKGNLLKGASEKTQTPYIDKPAYFEPINNPDVSHLTASFGETKMAYIYQGNYSKEVYLEFRNLNKI